VNPVDCHLPAAATNPQVSASSVAGGRHGQQLTADDGEGYGKAAVSR